MKSATKFLYLLLIFFGITTIFLVFKTRKAEAIYQLCGAQGQECCEPTLYSKCNPGLTCTGLPATCQGINPPACGDSGQECCANNACDVGLSCQGNFCISLPAPTPVPTTSPIPDPVDPSGAIPPPKVNCGDTGSPEFNSLRPYQASACGDSKKALFCGNNIIIYEEIDHTYTGGPEVCNITEYPANKRINKTYIIQMEDMELPILGNTELTSNSLNNFDQIDDAQKMSEYLSWYLSGTINKAEYPVLDGEDEQDMRKIIDFSGPINKLLSLDTLTRKRIDSIKSASEGTTYIDDQGNSITEFERHDQIVGCTILGIPVPCYDSFLSSLADNERRLTDWESHLPPLREDFDDYSDYNIAYRRWRGKSCAKIPVPVINKEILFCFNNPLKPDFWSTLFANVPLSSTEDKKSKQPINNVQIRPIGQTQISPDKPDYYIEDEEALHFPHTAEDKELSELLNTTFIPQDVEQELTYEDVESDNDETGQCRLLDVRSNPGDNLFPEVGENEYEVRVEPYTIEKIPCQNACNSKTTCVYPYPGAYSCTWETVWTKKCSGGVSIGIDTSAKVPNAKDIFTNTTAGTASTFRRIFPKVEKDAPVECIANIPTVTNATYLGFSKTSGSSGGESPKEIQVEEPSGVRTNLGTTVDTKFHFPYFGSVYEYFLKGIQTAIRPKGYGEPITNGQFCGGPTCGELPELPGASGSCSLGGISSRVGNIPGSLMQIVEAASQTYNTPPNLILGIMYGEGLFNPGRFDWTDDNVKSWASCEPIPGCNETGDDNFMGFNGNDFPSIIPHIEDDLKALDPNRLPPSQCNLLDTIYAVAWNLHDSADGGMGFSCFGIDLNASVPNSCSWSDNQYASAIKVGESGYTDMCFTKENSCATGGGTDAACPTGGDTCETITNRYTNPSHFGCVWDVAHGN